MTAVTLLPCLISPLHAQGARDAVIDPAVSHQAIRGFGGANILPWRPDMTDSEIETAFGTENGQLGLSILRLMIEPVIGNWALNLPAGRKAHDMGVLIFASPWNAPVSMLETVNGQKRVRYDKYQDYAYHLDDFNYFMEDNGVPIYAISVQNEPDYGDWTRWTAQEMYTFMKENAQEIGTRVMAAESFQFRHEMTDPVLNDPVACANLDIVGGHLYGGGLAPYPLAESKGKEVWMTEHWSDGENSGNDWPLALNIGAEISSCMQAGMHAYVLWYIVRYYGLISDGTNDSGAKGEVTKRGYVMSQYARFVRPGYVRVEATGRPRTGIYVTAYKGDSRLVIVAVNQRPSAVEQTFWVENLSNGTAVFTPYVTTGTQDCIQENGIALSGSSFTVLLEGHSITTFVAEGVSGVRNARAKPERLFLSQNYPNPFNPVTTIRFHLPEKRPVRLVLLDIRGHVVQEIVRGEYGPGNHAVTLQAEDLATGVYFYRLEAGALQRVRKCLLVK